MVRVWFGNESDGLQRDRKEHVLTIERPCPDHEAIKKFYCEGLGFYVTGVTSSRAGRMLYLASKRLPSVALGFLLTTEASPAPDLKLDIGVWNVAEWDETVGRMATLGFSPTTKKTANPHQKWMDYQDPTGAVIRYTYTQPPVTQKRLDPDAPRPELEG